MRTFFTWVLVIGVLLIVYVGQSGGLASSSTAATNYSSSHSVEYRVLGAPGGPGAFSVTYEDAGGGTAQIDTLHEKWNTSFSAASGQFLYISVQNGQKYGAVVCEIWVDGVRIKKMPRKSQCL